jgi:pimeloyl-ACP methyl ester carboxylesterase
MKFELGTRSIASRSLRLWLTAGLLSVFVLAGILSRPLQIHEKGIFETTPPSPYFHYSPQGTDRGKVLVIHGLDASKETMNLLSLGLSDAGFNVYSMDLPGHGDSTVGFNAVLAARAVASALDELGPETIVVGHSLGGALLLDLANDRSFSKMVLLSPAPTAVDRIRADHVLVLTGQFDLPAILKFVPQLSSPQIELQSIPWGRAFRNRFAARAYSDGCFMAWRRFRYRADWLAPLPALGGNCLRRASAVPLASWQTSSGRASGIFLHD